jgi:riboflavin synthase
VFTGIVQEIGSLLRMEARSGAGPGSSEDRRIEIGFAALPRERLNLGDSVCVDGVCLTVAALGSASFQADVSAETLNVTTLGLKQPGSRVNLEPALRVGDGLGGHWVSGHVDGIAEVISTTTDARSRRFVFSAPASLARYIARKGSVTLDGVSLTVNEVDGVKFGVNLIPHTLEASTLGSLVPGGHVNLEIDLLARYVERLSENT